MWGHILVIANDLSSLEDFIDTLVQDTDGTAAPLMLRSPQEELSASLVGIDCSVTTYCECGKKVCFGCDLNTVVDLREDGRRILCSECVGVSLWTILASLYRGEHVAIDGGSRQAWAIPYGWFLGAAKPGVYWLNRLRLTFGCAFTFNALDGCTYSECLLH